MPVIRFRTLLALSLVPVSLTAQTPRDSVRLKDLVVSATRLPVAARVRAVAADVLDRRELSRRHVTRLADALRLLPGAAMVSTGALGSTTSTFFRGVNSNQTLILIDGIRVNDANADPGSLLGGFELSPLDRLEIARGPQSTSFGGAAIGGVIAIGGDGTTGGPKAGAATEAGRFGTYRSRAFGKAEWGKLRVGGAATLVDTDNERPSNQYDQRTEHLRLEFAASSRLTVGGAVRGLQQHFTSPGDIRTTNTTPVGTTDFDQTLGTAFAEVRASARWSSRLTLGGQDYFLRGRSRFDGDEFVSTLGVTRTVADWQHRIEIGRSVAAVAGLDAEWSRVRDNDGPKNERLAAGYAEIQAAPTANLALAAGIRYDDYSTFGGKATGRITAGYFIPSLQAKIRGTLGTGFMPPSLAARYGSAFQRANPGLRPEQSRGFDVGVDRFLAAGRAVASLTVFSNRLTDLIGFESAPYPDLGRAINIARARTSGVEAAARAEIGRFDGRIGYTYLSATNPDAEAAERRLLRRPRHAVGADLDWAGGRFGLGGGMTAAFDRVDADFNVYPFARVDPGDFADVRLRASWRATSSVSLHARVDNLFGHRYEEAYGFPALGRRLQFGLSFEPTR